MNLIERKLSIPFTGSKKEDCTSDGACWVFINVWFERLMYGLYPINEILEFDSNNINFTSPHKNLINRNFVLYGQSIRSNDTEFYKE